jgi:hypothetical protein
METSLYSLFHYFCATWRSRLTNDQITNVEFVIRSMAMRVFRPSAKMADSGQASEQRA